VHGKFLKIYRKDAAVSISLSLYWKTGHWASKKKVSKLIHLISERFMTESLNLHKKKLVPKQQKFKEFETDRNHLYEFLC
jgi:hypothetical protein